MKTLITGAGGFLGQALVSRLLAHGYTSLRCMVRSRPRNQAFERLRAQYPDASIEVFSGNLLSREDAARALEDCDLVFHVAAAMRGAPADMIMNTCVASKRLLEGLAGRKPRIVLVSSFAVYGTAGLPWRAVVDERTPLETRPELRDPYAFSKLRQESLFAEYRDRLGFDLVTVRPGVLYGPGGGGMSSRVGQFMFGRFFHFGHSNRLPLNYVDNCAEALAIAGRNPEASGQVYNAVDDGLPTCRQYLRLYRREVKNIPVIPVPYSLLLAGSWAVEKYHAWSQGQLPAAFTVYSTRTLWKGTRFDNSKLKGLGWKPIVSTEEGLRRAFAWLREQEPNNNA